MFYGEPDIPVALGAYRRAVLGGDPIGPAGRYLVEWEWLAEMYERVRSGKPPVTEAEFDELAEWFRTNEKRLPFNGAIDMGGGRRVDRINLRCQLSRGPRSAGVTDLVEDLRRFGASWLEGLVGFDPGGGRSLAATHAHGPCSRVIPTPRARTRAP